MKLWRKKENKSASFAVTPQTMKVTATVPGKFLIMMGKVLKLWVEDMNRERTHSHNFYYSILLLLFYFINSYCC